MIASFEQPPKRIGKQRFIRTVVLIDDDIAKVIYRFDPRNRGQVLKDVVRQFSSLIAELLF